MELFTLNKDDVLYNVKMMLVSCNLAHEIDIDVKFIVKAWVKFKNTDNSLHIT